MQRRTIGIYISSEQKGFFVSLGKLLARDHDVWFVVTNKDVKQVILKKAPELSEKTIVLDKYEPRVDPRRIMQESLEREKKYGERFAMLMSYDRAFGQGYLLNADRHPHVIRSMWPHRRKLESVLEEFLTFESVYEQCSFDLVLGHYRPVFLDLIAKYHGAKYLSLGLSRYEDRYIWFETVHEGKEAYSKAIKKYLDGAGKGSQEVTYRPYKQYTVTAKSLDYSYWYALKRAARTLALEVYIRLRRAQRRHSYIFCGWIPPLLRSPANYRYVLRQAARPVELEKYEIIYFPLHQEPESSLLNLSPEFNNSMEIISWISKALPANAALVVKENPWSFGVRSRRYYRNLVKIPNVFLAHPEVSSLEWIERSKTVVTITGTAGFEAVYLGRPVLSFGKHQIINELPTVKYVDSFFTTSEGMHDLMAIPPGDERFKRSRYGLHNALMDVSFSIPGYEKIYGSSELHLEQAGVALSRLYQEYPEIFLMPEEKNRP